MEPAIALLPPLHCTPDNCAIAQLFPSPTHPLTHDDTVLAWKACTSLAQLCHLQLHYYHSHLPFTPTYNGALHSESQPILASLAALASSRVFLPTFSQPAVDEEEYNCYYVRKGCPQRAAVSGWTSEVGVKRIRAAWPEQADSSLHICITPPTNYRRAPFSSPTLFCLHPATHPCVTPITHTTPPSSTAITPSARPSVRQRLGLPPLQQQQPAADGSAADKSLLGDVKYVVASCGGGDVRYGKELEDWKRGLSGAGRRCMEVDGWMVWCVDEQWGRKQWLWHFLIQALTTDS